MKKNLKDKERLKPLSHNDFKIGGGGVESLIKQLSNVILSECDTLDRHSEQSEESHKLIHYAKTAVISLALSFFITAPVLADNAPVPQDNHAYTLTKVDAPGENVITKYEWSNTEKKYVPVYYRVDLNKTEYGHKDVASETKTFTIKTPNVDGSGNAFNYEIKYYTDASRLAPSRVTTDQNGADIDKDFIGKVSSDNGGAIHNSQGTIGNITGDFIGNYAQGSDFASGGAIYNYNVVTIGDIKGDFIGNYTQGNYSAYGGAIYNSSYNYNVVTIGDITGDFIGNYAQCSYSASGGAIYNYADNSTATIRDITGDFIGNYAQGSYAYGGAIYNSGSNAKIESITGDFIGNYAQGSYSASGGAIYNSGTIGDITGDFIGNYAQADSSNAIGGAIFNYYGTIGDITGDFVGNYAKSDSSNALGGAIYNYAGYNTTATIGLTNNNFLKP